jgi:hypothetical protein
MSTKPTVNGLLEQIEQIVGAHPLLAAIGKLYGNQNGSASSPFPEGAVKGSSSQMFTPLPGRLGPPMRVFKPT